MNQQSLLAFVDSDVIISSLLSDQGAAYALLHQLSQSSLLISNFSERELAIVIARLNIASEKLDSLLAVLNTMEPVGCGVFNVTESLMVQAQYYYPEDDLLQVIIKNYLPNIQRLEYDRIAKNLNIRREEVKEKLIVLTNLTPFPGAFYLNSKPIYVRPDIEVQVIDDEVVIQLVDNWIPRLYINAKYVQMLKQKKVDEKIHQT
mgnify:CR=1 FL=1